ncbi:MAG: preprotein translocase subunit SecA [Planctomycetota bacterium]|nr:preprotein translocase subunit SecA [Planctomycetota bacterium]
MLLHRAKNLLQKVNEFEDELQALDDARLRKFGLSLRYRAKSGEPSEHLLPECYALVREAARRRLGMRHYDVQIIGGIVMHFSSIAEMQTGEGKTLTATLPMTLAALAGKGAQLATVNDYLAARDADWMRPVYESVGLSVGVIESQMMQNQRREAYASDVTYGTAKEFGFDFLRDRLLLRRIAEEPSNLLARMSGQMGGVSSDNCVQRPAWFALVDEADSILIDEARTPLIISAAPTEDQKAAVEAYCWSAEVADEFEEDRDYEYDHEKRTVELTAVGRRLVRSLDHPDALDRVGMVTIYEYIEQAVKVSKEFFLDRQYVVRDGEIVIVDEFTGRLSEGRKWRAGIHQAVEAKEMVAGNEDVEVTVETGQAARVTVQDFFLRYPHLAGMTGTARSSARELKKIYKLNVVTVPTNRPVIREELAIRTYGNSEAKWKAIVDEIRQLHSEGRPVLVGTRSIDKSEILSGLLQGEKIEHQVLNANHVAAEAEIVAQAGRRGTVTIATNMAGRGTDILLGGNPEHLAWSMLNKQYRSRLEVPSEEWQETVQQIREEEQMDAERDEILNLGGLHVICTEWHESGRIDRQLIGRCGRQGDPGTYRRYAALDDEILSVGYSPKKADRLIASYNGTDAQVRGVDSKFRRAQRRIERRHFRGRKSLMYQEKLRKKLQKQMGQDPYLDTPS